MNRRTYKRRYSSRKVFDFIVRHKRSHDGNSPSLSEIGVFMSINSGSTVRNLLKDLVDEGKIKIPGGSGSARQIEVVGGEWTYVQPT